MRYSLLWHQVHHGASRLCKNNCVAACSESTTRYLAHVPFEILHVPFPSPFFPKPHCYNNVFVLASIPSDHDVHCPSICLGSWARTESKRCRTSPSFNELLSWLYPPPPFLPLLVHYFFNNVPFIQQIKKRRLSNIDASDGRVPRTTKGVRCIGK